MENAKWMYRVMAKSGGRERISKNDCDECEQLNNILGRSLITAKSNRAQ